MSSELNQNQIEQISRVGIKKLIEKYSQSQGKDQQSLTMLFEQLAKTPLFFAVQKGTAESNGNLMRFMTLTVGGQTFVPIFTSPDELGKLEGNCDCVCLRPMDYCQMLVDNDRHAVINPFGTYFLLWPELVREHMLPYMKQAEDFARQQRENPGIRPIS